jgi:hypothetical protein
LTTNADPETKTWPHRRRLPRPFTARALRREDRSRLRTIVGLCLGSYFGQPQ